MGCVYRAKNKINGKSYIGKTKDCLKIRRSSHRRSAEKGVDTLFYRAIRKYGFKTFKWRTLAKSDDPDELDELEIRFIKRLETKTPGGYNVADGGGGCTGCHWKRGPRSEEHRRKLGRAHKGKKLTEKQRDVLRKNLIGRPVSDETRARIGAANKIKMKGKKNALGHRNSSEVRKSMGAANKGRVTTEETKKRISAATKGKKRSKETRARISEAMVGNKNALGYKHSEEAKIKIGRASRKRRKVFG